MMIRTVAWTIKTHLPIVYRCFKEEEGKTTRAVQHITNSKTHMTTLHNTHRHSTKRRKNILMYKKQVVAQAMKVDHKNT